MKLIVAGATGFVATEVIRQAIRSPSITSIVALARRETSPPKETAVTTGKYDISKFKSIICKDFGEYSEEVKAELAGAHACIWLLAVTPSKARALPVDEVRKICLDYTVAGMQTMLPLATKPFRFIYTSGAHSERDQTKRPYLMADYALMRGKVETAVINHAKESNGAMEACITKPGLIDAPGRRILPIKLAMTAFCSVIGLPQLDVSQIAATLIHQAVNGIEKETLLNEDLVRIGDSVLAKDK